ncbi:MAG: single-stranded DNA-binding protein [Lamprobacter sp.]|uniref:single-stranded DNA-binding protein n=1 Tax=Lamprobacter sp. TaxID=3100796 RepID=UPI002B25B4DF|nr:single-stranded DNA-binding protein [Lamprobacter sp.]MEA3643099.1 single-stranded DNA-binding protein [Lamprobacter sp.]
MAHLSLATTERWTDKQGQAQERTEWHRVVLFARTAEIAERYLRCGSLIYVEGRLQTRRWNDDNGQERQRTEVVAERLKLLDRRPAEAAPPAAATATGANARTKPAGPPARRAPEPAVADFNDDLPF